MADRFKEACRCPFCSAHLQKPVCLKCGYTCCLRCADSLQREPDGEGLLCPGCSVVSQKQDIKLAFQLRELVDTVKELEPHLSAVLYMNPRTLKFQVDVTLEEDTANSCLVVSEDRKTVHCGLSPQTRRECPERFDYSLCVLGSPGFTSGRRYWEVDVGSSRKWDVGICREWANRKGLIELSSEHGFWTLSLRDDDLFCASTVPLTRLFLKPRLNRVGIFVDLDIGTISFCNVTDGAYLFTFTKISPRGPLHPFFAPADIACGDEVFLRVVP
ncbi:ret finger protein-like 4A-like protein 1 [Lepus europaeus]|uniref:ret finger protein-like 4A-like protein 1 n=1 Tax=Lepus europaeus TaxID=9983 RepID=UPI002B4A5A39|nr:ret finger protein-like 4A-like protein 1 [Lepus europaeus]